ncbi:MAG TPA: hypothetical protein DDY86_07810 [Syntrophaceae bacterium]|jgi:hypothetical protein|nr:hypothetical protein [Syntrophaceae bacterium]
MALHQPNDQITGRSMIRPGMLINENRIAFIRRDAQGPPNTSRFMIVLVHRQVDQGSFHALTTPSDSVHRRQSSGF